MIYLFFSIFKSLNRSLVQTLVLLRNCFVNVIFAYSFVNVSQNISSQKLRSSSSYTYQSNRKLVFDCVHARAHGQTVAYQQKKGKYWDSYRNLAKTILTQNRVCLNLKKINRRRVVYRNEPVTQNSYFPKSFFSNFIFSKIIFPIILIF